MQQLKIVNDEEFDAVLLMHPACLGSQLQNGKAGLIINKQR